MDLHWLCAEILKILKNHGIPQVDFLAQVGKESYQATVTANDDGPQGKIYCIGSISKILVACGFHILKSDLRSSEEAINLDDPIRNHIKNLRLPERVTIRSLLLHISGIPDLNDFLLGPDGSVWASEEELFDVINYLDNQEHEWNYSNVGYILIGYLIKSRCSQKSLGQFLKERLFEPLKMDSTFLGGVVDTDAVTTPHVVIVDENDEPKPVKRPKNDYGNTAVAAAMGIYSSTPDLAKFFRALMAAHTDQDSITEWGESTVITKDIANNILSWTPMGDGLEYGFGICRSKFLNVDALGRFSLNHFISRPLFKEYSLGEESIEVLSHGGAVTGYESYFYLLPEKSCFVIVLTNATGLGDASDIISRLLLQKLLNLGSGANIMELSQKCAEERANGILGLIKSSPENDNYVRHTRLIALANQLPGEYHNKEFSQWIKIFRDKKNLLVATVSPKDASCNSQPEFVVELGVTTDSKEPVMRLFVPTREDFALLGVDIYISWDLTFLIIEENNTIFLDRDSLDRAHVRYKLSSNC